MLTSWMQGAMTMSEQNKWTVVDASGCPRDIIAGSGEDAVIAYNAGAEYKVEELDAADLVLERPDTMMMGGRYVCRHAGAGGAWWLVLDSGGNERRLRELREECERLSDELHEWKVAHAI